MKCTKHFYEFQEMLPGATKEDPRMRYVCIHCYEERIILKSFYIKKYLRK